jgi:ferric-dicitrate binding protein FerR (iron transport regulator)
MSLQISARRVLAGAILALAMWGLGAWSANAQQDICTLAPDPHNAVLSVMTCGADGLVVREAAGTRYQRVSHNRSAFPDAIRLDVGAVMVEFHPSEEHKNFEILTPIATAAVRGTRWIVIFEKARMSAFVIDGGVAVARRHARKGVTLGPGEGVDIDSGSKTPLVVKRWRDARVKALLQRFGE